MTPTRHPDGCGCVVCADFARQPGDGSWAWLLPVLVAACLAVAVAVAVEVVW